jgi:hypothetical protein
MSKQDVKGSGDVMSPNRGGRTLRLESLYLASGFRVSNDERPAHSILLRLSGRLDGNGKASGSLFLDPNECSLNAFGDPAGCTKIAIREIEVNVVRQRLGDPKHLGRKYFQVTGSDLPTGLGLIIQGAFERCYLKLDDQVVPLYRARRV